MTRFGEISPLWQKFTSLWQIFDSSFHSRQNIELTGKFVTLLGKFSLLLMAKYSKIIQPSGHMVLSLQLMQKQFYFPKVANRSNSRIEIFSAAGIFLRNFGTEGNMDGQFNRPSSVCCDSKDRIIVADKDNHRIQV